MLGAEVCTARDGDRAEPSFVGNFAILASSCERVFGRGCSFARCLSKHFLEIFIVGLCVVVIEGSKRRHILEGIGVGGYGVGVV
jgi:hypothetical protein